MLYIYVHINVCILILQHYTFWKKEIPTNDEELKKFQSILVNLDVPIRLYKEAYDVTGYESITKFISIQLVITILLSRQSTPKKRRLDE